MNINNPTSFSTPDLTLSTSNSSGTSGAIRADDTILVYDVTVPTTIGAGDSAATGNSETAARRNHVHGSAAAYTTFAAPSFTLGTSNVSGSGNSVHAGATLLAFDATLPDVLTFGQSGAVGSAVVTSRRDHAHEMPAAPNLGSAMENFVENGLRCVYMLGAPKASAFADGDEVGMGQQFTFGISGAGGTLAPSTVIRGGWALTAGNADTRRAHLTAGDAVLSAASDLTMVCRVRRDAGEGTSWFGLGSIANSVRTTNDIILFSWARAGGAIACITDNGGSETVTEDVATVADDTDVTFRIEVSGDGGTAKFYVDDTLETTHTANIPTSTALYIVLNQGSNTAATTTLNIADIFAWRTS